MPLIQETRPISEDELPRWVVEICSQVDRNFCANEGVLPAVAFLQGHHDGPARIHQFDMEFEDLQETEAVEDKLKLLIERLAVDELLVIIQSWVFTDEPTLARADLEATAAHEVPDSNQVLHICLETRDGFYTCDRPVLQGPAGPELGAGEWFAQPKSSMIGLFHALIPPAGL